MNPRSIYNKINEFHTFVEEEQVDLVFMSESWEREELTLENIINLEDHVIISNVHQRRGRGGRPAIIVNNKKYIVENITNKLLQVKWGVEAVWCILTPKNITNDSKIQKIACASIYCKPGSKSKTDLLDHIAEAYNVLSTKYSKGLHFIIAGDTNELKLDSILTLSQNLVQVVQKPTRIDSITGSEKMLDPVIMTLSTYYQEPQVLDPLDSDPDKNGKPSDHKIVLQKPISLIENKTARITREVKVRPIPQSGLDRFRTWLIDQDWKQVFEAVSAHDKAEIFQKMLLNEFEKIFPIKVRKISSDDAPWISQKIKKLIRQRQRIYHKNRKSEKWKKLHKVCKKEIKSAKANFYKNQVADLLTKSPKQWYSSFKRLTSYDQHKTEPLYVEEISTYSDKDQVEMIADHKAKISNLYEPLLKDDIKIPPFSTEDIPQFLPRQVWLKLCQLKTNKGTVRGDLPAKIWKIFAAYLAEPLTDIFNTSLSRAEYPKIYKFEIQTPVAKVIPCLKLEQIRNISGLLTPDKIFETLLSELIIEDMKGKIDVAQYGNQRNVSIQHYLINLIHKILTAVDINSQRETFAVIATMIDWKQAFSRQCHKLGIISFMENNVRTSIIPLLVNYFQDRQMVVKHHGCWSVPRTLNGGGPEGATLGILEYLSQSNLNAECVGQDERFKFVDDLTVLEIINILNVGLSSFNVRHQVPSDIPDHNQFIPAQNLKSQEYLDSINIWTHKQKMKINEEKTKAMIFNFTNNYQFTTRMQLNNENIQVVTETKLLGTHLTNDLKWDKNTNELVKKANARLQLLRKIKSFNAPLQDLKQVYITFIRSLLEQSCTVWNSMLTNENIEDIERVQKSALKIIFEDKYSEYKNALNKIDLESLAVRREDLCVNFARKNVNNAKLNQHFVENNKTHKMKTRNAEKYKVNHAQTERQ